KLNLDQLLRQIVALLARHSPRELTYSKVSRLCGVPRSTLYYYFGKSAKGMIQEAVRYGIREFVQLHSIDLRGGQRKRYKHWEEFQNGRMAKAIDLVREYPWAPTLYFRYCNDPTELGEEIRAVEERYCKKLSEAWEQFQGVKPSWRAVRLSSYLKLGLLYGVTRDPELWFGPENERAFRQLTEEITAQITKCLSTRYE
ncbi:MAG: TetR/AcrR family transcriptional regulator, partial [Bacteriovoracia bacterium]